MDIYQGSLNLISPAIGNYNLQTYLEIDKNTAGETGGTGVTGTGTLTLVDWAMGVTGLQESRFTNAKHGF